MIKWAYRAIEARKNGVFDDPDLNKLGELTTTDADILRIKRLALEAYDFTISERDPRVNTDYPGKFMVVECLADQKLPFANPGDGSGDFALVGDDLDALIAKAFDALTEMCGL